jgi:hypothetical protein
MILHPVDFTLFALPWPRRLGPSLPTGNLPNRWLCKEAKFKARESRGVRRTSSTPQRQRDDAQRRNWTIYEAIIIVNSTISSRGCQKIKQPSSQFYK